MKNLIKATSLLFIAAILMIFSVVIVSAGDRVVVTHFGAVKGDPLTPGFHVKLPFVQMAHKFDVRERKVEINANSASRDLQTVSTLIAVNFHLDEDNVGNLYQEVGMDYVRRIVEPSIQESVKAATAQFSAEELITKRVEVGERIRDLLSEKIERRHIVLDDVNIVNFSFSPEFDASIEAKQIAEQNALRAQQDLKRVEIEAQQKIEQARAEAESLRLQRANVTAELIELRKIEAQMEAIKTWNGILPTYTGGAMPFLDVSNLGQ